MAQSIIDNSFPTDSKRKVENCTGSDRLQQGSRCSYVVEGEKPEVLKKRTQLSEEEFELYKSPQGLVELNQEGISMAVEKRVALFFQQAILCYGMSNFTFSAKTADAQIGSSPAMQLKTTTDKRANYKREAAHSSTIPTLLAKEGNSPAFVFLKGGTSYYQHNATIGMSEYVNGADELLDGKTGESKLRNQTISLINKVAQKTLNPVDATKQFCTIFQDQVVSTSTSLQTGDPRKNVLNQYVEEIKEIKEASKDNQVFDQLLGVIIDTSLPHAEIIRKEIYQKKYDIIQLQEVIESRIEKRISDVKKILGGKNGPFLEHILLKEIPEGKDRIAFEKLIGKTAAFITNPEDTRSSKTFLTRISNLYRKHQKEISSLITKIRQDFTELKRAEITYRAGVFKALRTKVNQWTQIQFCEEHLKKTARSVSQAWVSRVEQLTRHNRKATYETPLNQRRRALTVEEGKQCAQTFGVDAGLFLPCLFTSSN